MSIFSKHSNITLILLFSANSLYLISEFRNSLYSHFKKSSIKNYLKEKGVDNEKWIDLIVDQVSIKGEDVVEDRGKQLLDMYNTMVADPKLNITPNQHQNNFNKDNQLDEILKEAGEQVKNSI